MNQTRSASAIESVMNVAIGYMVAICSQVIIFPIYNIHVTTETHLKIGVFFTVISLFRTYAIRRLFNAFG